MHTGISIYPGLDNSPEENARFLEQAARLGISRVFLSLPEATKQISATQNEAAIRGELTEIVQEARRMQMEVILDATETTLDLLGIRRFTLSAFQFLGIATLRVDMSLGAKRVAELSRNMQGIRILLNGSIVTGKLLTSLLSAKADFTHMGALFAFYPREGTGLSEATFVRKCAMLHKAGMDVGAFVPCHYRRRSPLRAGLPTLEMHRDVPIGLAARHLAAIGVDAIYLGDSLPSDSELESLAKVSGDRVETRARLLTADPVQKELLGATYTARLDEARDAVRAQESRRLLRERGEVIEPMNQKVRPYGAITLDNKEYGTYMGELQIMKRPQPADSRVNVAAVIPEEEQFLINYIIPGKKFSFDLY